MEQKLPEEPVTIEVGDDHWELCEELNQETLKRLETVGKCLSKGEIDNVFISDFFDRLSENDGQFRRRDR